MSLPACQSARPLPCPAFALQSLIGVQMFGSNFFSFLSPEGYLVGACAAAPCAVGRPTSALPVLHLPGVFPHAASLLAHEPPHPIFLQDFEPKESDLWGSRGVALAGLCMLFMAINNFRGTLVGGRVGARLGGWAPVFVSRGCCSQRLWLLVCPSTFHFNSLSHIVCMPPRPAGQHRGQGSL